MDRGIIRPRQSISPDCTSFMGSLGSSSNSHESDHRLTDTHQSQHPHGLRSVDRMHYSTDSTPGMSPGSGAHGEDDEDLCISSTWDQELNDPQTTSERLLYLIAGQCRGLSGRGLRKLPVKAHAFFLQRPISTLKDFLSALHATILMEASPQASAVFV